MSKQNSIITFEQSDSPTLSKNRGETAPFLRTDDEIIQGFFLDIGGSTFVIPEPNITVIYFSNAQGFLAPVLEYREVIINHYKTNPTLDSLNHIFSFYSVVTSFVSSLSNSMEAFVNSKIPKDIRLPNRKRRGEYCDKHNILRYWNLEQKLKSVLADVYGKSFLQEKSHHYNEIKKLIELRNDITHAKADINYEVNYYEKLYVHAFNFDYFSALESVKELINFYEPNLIEPCNCGQIH